VRNCQAGGTITGGEGAACESNVLARTNIPTRMNTHMTSSVSEVIQHEAFRLSRQQVAYFETFGFLLLPGLFRKDIEAITAGFERIFADPRHEHWELGEGFLHGGRRRVAVPSFIDKDEALRGLRDDPRILAVARGLIGDDYEFAESDGNVWYCETYWHSDVYGSPLSTYHVKLSFYLDSLRGDNGAIRLIPGSNFYSESFAQILSKNLANNGGINEVYGVEGKEIPSWTLESEPGDLIVWNQRTIHASYNGEDRRRSFALTFRERETPGEAQ
jgi:hypothetical protein